MSRTHKRLSKSDFPATQPARMSEWATGIFFNAEAMKLTRTLDEAPFPQRTNKVNKRQNINKQTSNTNINTDQQSSGGLQNTVTPLDTITNLNPADNNNNNNTNTDSSNNGNTGDHNKMTFTYGSSISGITSYKNNLPLALLDEPQHQTVDTSPSNPDVNATEQNSPITRVSNKLKTFVNNLRPSINALCSTAVAIKTIGNLVSSGNIPQEYTPVCRLGIINPPVTLTKNWNECLRECGHQLTAILINHHSECHQNMLKYKTHHQHRVPIHH